MVWLALIKQDKVTINHGRVLNIYIVYEIIRIANRNSNLTVKNALFVAVSLTKNANFKYSGYIKG